MVKSPKAALACCVLTGALLAASPASAHHVMDGRLPATFLQGLLSGLGHPIIGLDHLAFVVGVGLMSKLAGRIVRLPLLFVAGTLAGCLTHLENVDLPFAEFAVASTVAITAGLIALRCVPPAALLATLFAVAGFFHGYAYGESIVGAEPAPLSAYLIGFSAIQYAIALASAAALDFIVARQYATESSALRIAGAAMALMVTLTFVSAVLAG